LLLKKLQGFFVFLYPFLSVTKRHFSTSFPPKNDR
jgi:hypothetical protein